MNHQNPSDLRLPAIMSEHEQKTSSSSCSTKKTFGSLNKNLLVSKLFYFCYWGAVGSFFPLLGVYFKQLGMNPSQSGILVGCRPMVEFFSAPLLGSLADRLNKRKTLLIFSLVSWVSFTFSLAFIKPAPVTCRKYFILTKNVTQLSLKESSEIKSFLGPNTPQEQHPVFNAKSSLVFSQEGVQQVFLVLLFLTIVGEFFSAPAITLADAATLGMLGENKELYGRQRLWGSLGWGTAMFFLGFVIDEMEGVEICGEIISQNYTVGFYFFAVFMSCALIVATRFKFKNKYSEVDEIAAGSGAALINILLTVRYGAFLFVSFFMGFGLGLIFTFLFWHLEDLGGPPTLFGVASLIDHISEIVCYFNVGRLIRNIGHIKVIYIGLVGNVIRFLYISWLENPWLVLPLEVLQGITHAAVWAACTSYMGRVAPPGYGTSAQGVLQGLHHGLGRGCGAIIGGLLIHHFGTNLTFRGYGVACSIILLLYVLILKTIGPDDRLNWGSDSTGVKTKVKLSPTTSASPSPLRVSPAPLHLTYREMDEPKFGKVVGKEIQPRSNASS